MKLNSPIFDRIRVKPQQDRRVRSDEPQCNWPGCACAATHRAPKGRLREGQYWRFCLEHVREYNNAYNYFAGMSDDAVARFQKDAVTGHRPTWKMGLNGRSERVSGRRQAHTSVDFEPGADPFGLFAGAGNQPGYRTEDPIERRTIRNAERKALHALGLDIDAKGPDIKARFKALVKRHHPDANGGDRGSEDKLREIIQAYGYLKSVGLC